MHGETLKFNHKQLSVWATCPAMPQNLQEAFKQTDWITEAP